MSISQKASIIPILKVLFTSVVPNMGLGIVARHRHRPHSAKVPLPISGKSALPFGLLTAVTLIIVATGNIEKRIRTVQRCCWWRKNGCRGRGLGSVWLRGKKGLLEDRGCCIGNGARSDSVPLETYGTGRAAVAMEVWALFKRCLR